ncbi:MAG: sulfatase-like hydrolase/transferase, partial [Gemmatimonadetes bacterium]|nr:sulfatase-like hydrolase/transferase [Gemmatimonadota bacterium]
TAAILKSDVINAGRGYEQGFEYFQFLAKKPKDRLDSGAQLTDAALQWLESQRDDSRPFFLYLHYMDPHTSYIAPEPFYSKYSTEFESSLDGNHGPIVAFNEEGSPEPTADDVEKLLALYDGEIEYWDTQFGRLVEYFETSGLIDETIVVVTADHGEAFWEHELFEHRGVFQENISVPMIFRVPGVEPRRIDSWVQMTDIGPTVVDLVGVERGPNWVGLSHAEAIRSNEPVQEQAVSSEWAGERILITPQGLKILIGHGEPRLYDLDVDPGETQNLATRRPEDLARLKTILDERFHRALELRDVFAPASPAELTPEQIEALKALGYLGD